MTNEEIYEEILHAAHARGIYKQVMERIKNTDKEYPTQSKLDVLVRAYYSEKALHQDTKLDS